LSLWFRLLIFLKHSSHVLIAPAVRVAKELQKTRALLIDQVTTISGRQRSQSYNHTDKGNGDMAIILVNRPEDHQLTGRNM